MAITQTVTKALIKLTIPGISKNANANKNDKAGSC